MKRKVIFLLVVLALSLCVFTAPELRAEKAGQEEMELVCRNWLSYMVFQRGTWSGDTRPQIVKVDEIVEGDTVLARSFSISPRGFVVVPILKELPPIKAYSDDCNLDPNQRVGFPQLLREILLHRIRQYVKIYGSLDAVQPPSGDVLLGREHREEWNKFLKSENEFKTDMAQGKLDPLTQAGPLLTTFWHQGSPYNNLCPIGDGGRCVVGCVATAAAQIMNYHEWPPSGTGSHSYTWDGDQSCGGNVGGGTLNATFSDSYDWQNMPNSCPGGGCTPTQQGALAELSYELGNALHMDYGVCGSGAWPDSALYAFPAYFGYDPSIDREDRNVHTVDTWFSIIQTEINNNRPMLYTIYSSDTPITFAHEIVCDGWIVTGGQKQYHMNYGWGGSYTAWYVIDNLYCGPPGCNPMLEYIIRNIMPEIPTITVTSPNGGEYWMVGSSHDITWTWTGSLPNVKIELSRNDGSPPWETLVASTPNGGTWNWTVTGPISTTCKVRISDAADGDPVDMSNSNFTITYIDIPFAPAVNYNAGSHPFSVFCADLDGDGDLDLAVANAVSNSVSILKNNGDGTFQTRVNYGAGSSPYSVFCADLDGDGDLDLAVANPGTYPDFIGTVSILKNNGNGTFQPKVGYGAGNYSNSVFCADLDGDDDLDLAVANENSDNVSILENNGDGTFQPKVDYAAGDRTQSVFCADLDGDDDLDLAVANYGSHNVSILINSGNGTFQPKVDYDAGSGPSSVFCADLDGDTDLDLAVANSQNSKVSILKNNGNGTFQPKVVYDAGSGPSSVFCADLDGDLDLDLAVANFWGDNVSILRNNGNGTFQTKVDYGTGVGPLSVFCADLDGDGDLDLAVANNQSNNVSILINLTIVVPPFIRGDANGDGVINLGDLVFLITYLYKSGPPPFPLVAGDVNCDGAVNLGDVVYLISYLYKGGSAPCEDKATISPEGGSELYKGKAPAKIGLSSPTISVDGIFEVPVVCKTDVDAAGVELVIKYDPEEIELLEPALTPRTKGLQVYSSTKDGVQKMGIVDITGNAFIFAGTGALVTLKGKGSDLTSLEISQVILVDKDAHEIPAQIVSTMKESEDEAEKSAIPQEFSLSQNYPNPFNPETEISYALPTDCQVKLTIYNVAGQKVTTLVDEHQTAGYKTSHWNGKDEQGKEVASGVYFYKIVAGDFVQSKKMLLMK